MLVISEEQMIAIEADFVERRRRAFAAWVDAHQALLGMVSAAEAGRILDLALPEAERAGIDTDERLFVYAAARGLMPAMSGAQYMLALDIVFSPLGQEEQLRAIVDLWDRSRG